MKSFQKYRKVIFIIFTVIIVALAIMLPIYFLVIKTSSSSQPVAPGVEAGVAPVLNNPIITMGSDTLGFCHSSTINGKDQPQQFINMDMMMLTSYLKLADVGGNTSNDIQYKWAYDPTNQLTIKRTIDNTNNRYTQAELSAIGTPSADGQYSVNKIISIYNKQNPIFTQNVVVDINPFILTTYSQCK
jgi:hypothetical protein